MSKKMTEYINLIFVYKFVMSQYKLLSYVEYSTATIKEHANATSSEP